MKNSCEIRRQFLDFFEQRGHTVVPSSSLIPANDPTLLFTNSGMVQFKDVFLGREKRNYTRAVSSQRCVRAGGKHNDLKNVGYTSIHHTLFEMLGNFSFGDYFKQEAIAYAWEFLTKTIGLPVDRLWVTVFENDDEAEKIWLDEIGIRADRLNRVGKKDNFWLMGDVGPCGPCTEIFYDHGEGIEGTPPGLEGSEGDRYVEIWNLVFMQYEHDKEGHETDLPTPSVDTGLGLERLTAVLQGVRSNYDTDLFQGLIYRIAELAQCDDLKSPSLRVIADHIRACSFLISDGVRPDNEGRGYVLRRIIRRAVRHGHRLGIREAFFYQLIEPLRQIMGDAYPELSDQQIQVVLKKEEERFGDTLEKGLRILEDDLHRLADKTITGEMAFKLYDTYGFPLDLTADIARERGLKLDLQTFETLMKQQQDRARQAHHFTADNGQKISLKESSRFSGYTTTDQQSTVSQIFVNGEEVKTANVGDNAIVILDETPFYAESGGQIGDTGSLIGDNGELCVSDTQKQGDTHKHIGQIKHGRMAVGDLIKAQIDTSRRARIVLNHSATHLLHAALKQVLGPHVSQRGSLVAEDRLRFDFLHDRPMEDVQLREVEMLVNEQIRNNVEVTAETMRKDDAINHGAVALFGEKYGDEVRVLTMGDFSIELCGGTHVQRTGDIGVFKILIETGVSSGVRRIEAVTGERAYRHLSDAADYLKGIRHHLQVEEEGLSHKIQQLIKENKRLKKASQVIDLQATYKIGKGLVKEAESINGIKVLAKRLDGGNKDSLRMTLDELKNDFESAAIVLATVENDKVQLIAGVTKNLTDRVKAGHLVKFVAEQVGGKGGGRPDMAEAGGGDPAKLDHALDGVTGWVRSQL